MRAVGKHGRNFAVLAEFRAPPPRASSPAGIHNFGKSRGAAVSLSTAERRVYEHERE